MNNCKNCGARYHPDECDYCGTPQYSTPLVTNKTLTAYEEYAQSLQSVSNSRAYAMAMLQNESYGRGLMQIRPKPSVWQSMLQGALSGVMRF